MLINYYNTPEIKYIFLIYNIDFKAISILSMCQWCCKWSVFAVFILFLQHLYLNQLWGTYNRSKFSCFWIEIPYRFLRFLCAIQLNNRWGSKRKKKVLSTMGLLKTFYWDINIWMRSKKQFSAMVLVWLSSLLI